MYTPHEDDAIEDSSDYMHEEDDTCTEHEDLGVCLSINIVLFCILSLLIMNKRNIIL